MNITYLSEMMVELYNYFASLEQKISEQDEEIYSDVEYE